MGEFSTGGAESDELVTFEADTTRQLIDDLFVLFPDRTTLSTRMRITPTGMISGDVEKLSLPEGGKEYAIHKAYYRSTRGIWEILHVIPPPCIEDSGVCTGIRYKITYEADDAIPTIQMFRAEGTEEKIRFWRTMLSDPEVQPDEFTDLSVSNIANGLDVDTESLRDELHGMLTANV